jgi:hypothetical protein
LRNGPGRVEFAKTDRSGSDTMGRHIEPAWSLNDGSKVVPKRATWTERTTQAAPEKPASSEKEIPVRTKASQRWRTCYSSEASSSASTCVWVRMFSCVCTGLRRFAGV